VASQINADSRRKQVVASAAELFDRAGYHTTNMAELARAVGLEKPTLYHYFSGKDEILFWIHEEFIDLLIAKAESRASDTELSARDELQGMMRDVLELMETHRGHVRVFFEHQRELAEERQETIRVKRDAYEERVRGVVERGIAAGEFRDIDHRLVTLAIFGMCNWAYQWYRSGGIYSTNELADFFHDLLLNGITPRT
jgi:AcrR family transcriptional regulator